MRLLGDHEPYRLLFERFIWYAEVLFVLSWMAMLIM